MQPYTRCPPKGKPLARNPKHPRTCICCTGQLERKFSWQGPPRWRSYKTKKSARQNAKRACRAGLRAYEESTQELPEKTQVLLYFDLHRLTFAQRVVECPHARHQNPTTQHTR